MRRQHAQRAPRLALSSTLLDRARRGGEDGIGVRADESDRPHHNHQNDCEHHRVLGDVLSLLLNPQSAIKGHHVPPHNHFDGRIPMGEYPRVGAGRSREHRTQREVPWRALTPEWTTFCAFHTCVSSHNNAKRRAPRAFSPQTPRTIRDPCQHILFRP
jgi:hypothetical protein